MNSSLFFTPEGFETFDQILAVHTLRDVSRPGGFSLRYGAGPEELQDNRTVLADAVRIEANRIVFPTQVHKDTIVEVNDSYDQSHPPEADALITNQPGWLIGVNVADCVAILIYDPVNQAIAAVHSGWRGSALNIASKSVQALASHYGSQSADLRAYLSPRPKQAEYEVETAVVSSRFDPQYSRSGAPGKSWFDNGAVVYDQLLAAGLRPGHIVNDSRSNLGDPLFHSFRRDGKASGRMFVGIGLVA